MARKARVKKVTISELQSYITGAMEFNDKDWHPNKEQWDKIVEMLMNVKQPQPMEGQVVPKQQGVRGESSIPVISSLGADAVPVDGAVEYDDAGQEVLPPIQRLDMRKIVPEKTSVPSVSDTGVVSSGIKIKTPNRDDSEAEYVSDFN